MSTAVNRRMLKEYLAIQKNSATRPHLERLEPLQENDLLHWQAVLIGTSDSAYEGGKFQLDIVIPSSYPIQPPVIHFTTKICHPNVHFKTGEICLDILKSEWTPSWNLESVCVAISSLLTNPEPSSPLNCDAGKSANLLRCGDMAGYNSLVKMYTELYAMDDDDDNDDK
ncbi:E2 ubiquitin-protein ligase peroxin 4 [Lunasporangiospora selenospora]|uniref:E2 ubiquitin-protein ligase peroxin 4 n=1 Tax=Lunasporangiospora selenospora TaxID=979761 RepID=A0A9P6FTI6_9FUNG|nr:E2 ubiquitin-protein ligase peroxin 4 [Lunasporangiospora selenospora]